MDCQDNRFCRSIDEGDRAKLCAICRRTRYEKGEFLPNERFDRELMLVLDGAFATISSANGKMQFLYTAFDINGGEMLFNDKPIKYAGYGLMEVIRPMEAAHFSIKELRELFMTCPSIARALYMNLATLDNRKAFYRIMVTLADAYHAVLYMMLYLQKRELDPPTHEELAFLTNLNRVTVSRVLKEIFRKERYGTLREYMEKTLADPDEGN